MKIDNWVSLKFHVLRVTSKLWLLLGEGKEKKDFRALFLLDKKLWEERIQGK